MASNEEEQTARIENGMPAIVSQSEFDEIQKLLSYNKLSGEHRKPRSNFY